jgi:predicted MFS family arabinose efflux permease
MPRSLVWLFAVASGLSVANVYYAQPLLDALAQDFGISHAAVGGVVTATQAGCAMALLLLVPLGDRVERRRLMALQLLALAAALVAVAMAQSVPALLAGVLAVGLLGTAMTQGLIAYAASAAAPQVQGRVVGAAQGGVFIGLLLARVFAGGISDVAGWRGVYLCAAVLMLLVALPLWRRLPVLPASPHAMGYWRLIVSMLTLLREEKVLQVRGVLALLMFAAFNIFWSALVFPLSAPPHGFSHTAIGALGLVGAVGALAAVVDGALAGRVGGGHRAARYGRAGTARDQPEHDFPHSARGPQPAGRPLHAVLCDWQRDGGDWHDGDLCPRGLAGRVSAWRRGQCAGTAVLVGDAADHEAGMKQA